MVGGPERQSAQSVPFHIVSPLHICLSFPSQSKTLTSANRDPAVLRQLTGTLLRLIMDAGVGVRR
jgi:hypothetical protein